MTDFALALLRLHVRIAHKLLVFAQRLLRFAEHHQDAAYNRLVHAEARWR